MPCSGFFCIIIKAAVPAPFEKEKDNRKGMLMKFLHTADLHIGKVLHEMSLLQDQQYVLAQIAELAQKEKVDAVVIAGDVYDRSIPSVEAVALLDSFLTQLSEQNITVLMISGNHDSGERLSFMDTILKRQKIYIAGEADRTLQRVDFKEGEETVTFVLLPFLKPSLVKAGNSEEAVRTILEREGFYGKELQPKDEHHKYVLVTHFFVTGGSQEPELSDSETTVNIGGIDKVDASLFSCFDYVALGHIHKRQKIGDGQVYYAGTPLKYSFSEALQEKSVYLVDTKKTPVSVTAVPLSPLHDMRKIKGRLLELTSKEVREAADAEDYIQAVITDKEELIDPMGTLRSVYPNAMQLIVEKGEKTDQTAYRAENVRRKTTLELFEEFYRLLREEDLDEDRRREVMLALEEENR